MLNIAGELTSGLASAFVATASAAAVRYVFRRDPSTMVLIRPLFWLNSTVIELCLGMFERLSSPTDSKVDLRPATLKDR